MRTFKFLLEKELRQISRDPFMIWMICFFPVIIMLVMPFAANLDFKDISVCIVDNDNSQFSRLLADKIDHSSNFILKAMPTDHNAAMANMNDYGIDIILEIPRDFEKNAITGHKPGLSIVANAVNASKASSGVGYLSQILTQAVQERGAHQGVAASADMITVKNLYNPTENYKYFMIPALTVMLIIIVCCTLPALNIVKEKEVGTIEQINVSPIGKVSFTLAKLVPYWLIGLLVISIAMLIAKWVYGLVPEGHLWVIYAMVLLFTLTISCLGLIVSNISSTMQQAMFVIFFFIMINVLMSGLMTPIESMPGWAQVITYFVPPRYFINTLRAVYLKGSGFTDVANDFAALGVYAIVLASIAVKSYKRQS